MIFLFSKHLLNHLIKQQINFICHYACGTVHYRATNTISRYLRTSKTLGLCPYQRMSDM